MKKKSFDCVEMKRKGAAMVLKRLRGMSEKEQLEYWHKRTEELRAVQNTQKRCATNSKIH